MYAPDREQTAGLPEPLTPTSPIGAAAPVPAEPTVFGVLAAQARSRTPAHLWLAAVAGVGDAAVLRIGHPALWWLAAGCAAAGAYGVWGLADRALAEPAAGEWSLTVHVRTRQLLLRTVRGAAVAAGTLAALAAAYGLTDVALGGWRH